MSTGAEHYADAEELIVYAAELERRLTPPGSPGHTEGVALIGLTLGEAQVHATLALAAATAYAGAKRPGEYGYPERAPRPPNAIDLLDGRP